MVFEDRNEAARLLAERLERYRPDRPLVLGVPRGGVPMAKTIADALETDLDVVLVHKLRAEEQPEYALGAIDEAGHVTANVSLASADPEYVEREKSHQLATLRQRRRLAQPLADYARRFSERDRAMAEAYGSGAYSMQAIADHFGVGRMTVSRAVKKHPVD